ncbi:ricin-type beta-trefoil lectin domain protein [Kitasatospora sp. NPDC049258]|uniref:ricin-type beta-trefoil lectin domain protein n=1 Tax=Kitasatospora sp. NPDC049258 TaxID=3155394 RepID=UPI0034403312
MSLVVPLAGAEVVGGYHYAGELWAPDPLQQLPRIDGRDADSPRPPGTGSGQPGARALSAHKSAAVQWPAETTSTVDLGAVSAKSAGATPFGKAPAGSSPVRAGASPVLLGAAAPEQLGRQARDLVGEQTPVSPPAAVQVKVADRAKAQAADVDGLLVGLTRADSRSDAGSVSVALDYGSIAQAYGGGWASRLRLVALPSCALTTPQLAECRRQQPVESTNDPVSQRITGTVALPAAGKGAPKSAAAPAAGAQSAAPAASGLAVAAVAGTGGSQGSYTATSLSASGTWSQSASGAFTYSYPIAVPPSLAGPAPSIGLSYNSQAVDGETSARNSQASWIGDGWSYSPGFIERSAKSCRNAGIDNSADQCWAGWNATLSLGSHSGELVRDANGVYHLLSDDGTRIERLTGAANGLWDGEYFKVTTTDGTAYYLGLNHAPGTTSDAATNSAWGAPVYHPNSGDPCYTAAKGKASQCDKQPGYRFNLDFVVDPNGDVQRYDWANEANYYSMGQGQAAAGGSGTLTAYSRGGYLTRVSYGYKLDDAKAGREPAARVSFDTAQRCVVSDSVCRSDNLSAATATNWPDVPFDLGCRSDWTTSGTGPTVCKVGSPTFWSTVRLRGVTTEVRTGGGWQGVDSYALTHQFSDAGGTIDPVTGRTEDPKNAGALQSVMWLSEIRHTGLDTSAGGSGAITLDPVTFSGIEVDNRVDGPSPAAPPLYRPRISGVQTESGTYIAVTYRDKECSRTKNTMPASADSNTMACFPVYWTTPGAATPIADWFHKTLVSTVTSSDVTKAGSPAQVVNYGYGDGAAWHRDDSELTDDQYRTWNDFRGYRTVTTTTGSAPYPVGQITVSYLQGMDGDYRADGTRRSIKWRNSLGEEVTDSPWLAGLAQESATYTKAGGDVVAKALPVVPDTTVTASSPRVAWTSESPAPEKLSELPDLIGRRARTSGGRQVTQLSDRSWRTTLSATNYDGLGRPFQVDEKGDVSVPGQETCTTIRYADAPPGNPMMLTYPSESLTVAGPCGTAAGTETTLSHKRTYYDGDGSLGNLGAFGTLGRTGSSQGLVTATQSVKSYDGSGEPVFQTLGADTFDAYGRVIRSLDAAGSATTVTYTPAAGILPTGVSTTNALGWTANRAVAPGRGVVTRGVDVNGRTTDSVFDALGRRSKDWLPGRSKDAGKAPSQIFEYKINGSGNNPDPSSVITKTLRENETYRTTVTVYDGLLQPRQTQATPANDTAGRIVSSTWYDGRGRPVIRIPAYSDPTTAPNSTLFVETENSLPSEQVTVYDGMGRPTAVKQYAKGAELWQSTTAYPGADRVDTTPPSGGTSTTVLTDARGRTTTSELHGGAGVGDVATRYTYKPGGQVATIADAAGNAWSYSYDLAGRLVSQTDPDGGTSSKAYDDYGRVARSIDGRGQSLSFTYDLLGRRTGEYSGSDTTDATKLLASWTFDSLAKGYPTAATRYVGGAAGSAYVTKTDGYNTAYQPTGTTTTIPASEGRLAGDYSATANYTPNVGLLAATNYRAEGGLPAESVGYGYDLQGELVQSGTENTALLDLANYNALGQLLQSTYGLNRKQFRTAQTYDDATGRLTTNRVSIQTATNNPVSATTYGYDEAGNLTNTSELQSSGGPDQAVDTQCFRYDGLDRLVEAWTDTWGVGTPTAGQVSRCNNTDPGPSSIGGPAPYWQSFRYNLLGDRTQQVKHDVTGDTARDITQTGSYPGDGRTPAAKPNTVTAVTSSTGAATRALVSAVPTGGAPLCLDVNAAWTADGTAIQTWTCNGSGAQKWTRGGDGTLKALGKCARPAGGGDAGPGTAIELGTCDGSGSQQWQDGADGALVNAATSLCLDIPGASSAQGTRTALWYCNGGANQQWPATVNTPTGAGYTTTVTPQYDEAGDTTARAVSSTGSVASSLSTGTATPLCLDDSGSRTDDGNPVVSYTCNGTDAQKWTLGTDGALKALGKCARPADGVSEAGRAVELWTCDGSPAQEWRSGAGGSMVNVVSGLCLDITGWDNTPGTRVALYTCHGGVNQQWTTGADTPAAGATQTFGYDAEGRTATVTTPSAGVARTSGYLYDAEGALLLQRGSEGTVLYLFGGAEQLTLSGDGNSVSGLRYYANPDGTVVVRSSTGALTYQPTNPQHTSSVQIDADTLAVTRRAFDPYGNPRGALPGSWADNHGYLGKPTDATSGLDLLGARTYDPSLGRFLTVDPVFEAGDPNQMGGYSYAADSPATKSDPTGLIPAECGKEMPCYGYSPGGGCPGGCGTTKNEEWGKERGQDPNHGGGCRPGDCGTEKPPLSFWDLQAIQQALDKAWTYATKPVCKGRAGCQSQKEWDRRAAQAERDAQNLTDLAKTLGSGLVHATETVVGAAGTVAGGTLAASGAVECGTGVLCVAGAPSIAGGLAIAAPSSTMAVDGARGLGDDISTLLREKDSSSSPARDPATEPDMSALKKVSKNTLKEEVGDVHAFKEEAVGKGAPVGRYDVFKDTSSGYLFLMAKNQKAPIPTWYRMDR